MARTIFDVMTEEFDRRVKKSGERADSADVA